ncbi:MAG: hypothetical protein DLM68_17515 [Hyphomicrobiales bacterium]|nr:MAG: hypothetical protein DLM68_17515 [Hyphomicrobiales bacterium]
MNDQAVSGRFLHARCGGCRGGRELPRGATTVRHRRQQRGAGAQRSRRTGCVAAKPAGGERHSRLKDERGSPAAPRRPIAASRHKARASPARHVHAGHGTIGRFFAKEKITF